MSEAERYATSTPGIPAIGAAIFARAARLDELQPRAREEGLGVFLQPAFRRHREHEGRAHGGAPDLVEPLDPHREADRRDRRGGAEPRQQSVIAPAGDELAVDAHLPIVQLEHEAGVVIEPAPERGRELDARDLDALRGEKAGAALEQVERGGEIDLRFGGERAQRVGGFVRIAADREKLLDQRARRARQAGACAERRLFEEAVRDLADRASADRRDAGDRQQIGDERVRGLRIGARERGEHALIFRPLARGGADQPVEIVREAACAVEVLDQPPLPGGREIERGDQRARTARRRPCGFPAPSMP